MLLYLLCPSRAACTEQLLCSWKRIGGRHAVSPRQFLSTRTATRTSFASSATAGTVFRLSAFRLSASRLSASRLTVIPGAAHCLSTTRSQLPSRLLIYHAGTPRTTFLACLKLSTLFGFAFFTFLAAPAYLAAEKPWWQVVGVASCGIIPFVLVTWTTVPFAAFVHLRLPPFARNLTGHLPSAQSAIHPGTGSTGSTGSSLPHRTLLRRFVQNPPPDTLLDITTLNLVGRPHVTTVAVGDLVPAHERLRVVNFRAQKTITGAATSQHASPFFSSPFFTLSSSFPWIHLSPLSRFGAPRESNSRGTREAWAWDDILEHVDRRARQAPDAPVVAPATPMARTTAGSGSRADSPTSIRRPR